MITNTTNKTHTLMSSNIDNYPIIINIKYDRFDFDCERAEKQNYTR